MDLVASSARARRPRLFATSIAEPRARQATDVILLVAAAAGLAVLGLIAVPRSGFEGALITFVRSLPHALDDLWQFLVDLLALLAIALVVAALIRRRLSLARDLVVAALVGLAASSVLTRVVLGSWPHIWTSLRAATTTLSFPSLRLAVSGAVVMTASPHLTKPLRRLGRWVIGLGALAAILFAAATPTGAAAALLVAVMSASAVHLVFGSSRGRPSLADVSAALTALGITARTLGAADRQPSGLFLVDALDDDGNPLVVKLYGRDAHDTQILTALYRTVWFREAGSPISLGRLEQVEHEALLTFLAGGAGIHTPRVLAAGVTTDDDVILVLRPIGVPLATVPDRWTPEVANNAWNVLRVLHQARIAHGQFDDQSLVIANGAVGLAEFRGAAIGAAPERMRTDEAQLVVTTALALGPDPALELAAQALGREGFAAALPFVQLTALTPRQRREVRRIGLDLDEIRTAGAHIAGVEPPELQKMRRVTLGSVFQVAMFAFAFLALASAVGGVDLDSLGRQIGDATWWLLAIGVVVAQLPRFAQAVSALGASPTPVPLEPLYALQLATSYIGLAIPTSAARIAVNVRFFQRRGLPTGSALAVGALDGFAGFIVQMILLLTILLFTSASLELDFDGSAPTGLTHLVGLIIIVGVAGLAMIASVRRWRDWVLGWVRRLATEALSAAKGLTSTRRIALLFGGNLASEVLFATALGAFVRAFGYSVGLTDLVLINVSVGLLAGVLPIPGGIGVIEGGLTLGLARAGMPEETALAAVLMYRLASFYLPPIWGFFAFRWLQRNHHI